MFHIIQSNDTDILVEKLASFYQKHPHDVFDDFVVITPARALDDWLKKTIAKKIGISTLITTQFWGQYQWQMIKKVLDIDNALNAHKTPLKVPEVAVLSQSVMRWQLFSYFMTDNKKNAQAIATDDKHPLYIFIEQCIQQPSPKNNQQINNNTNDIDISAKKVWQLANNIARVFVSYLTQRDDWLLLWSDNKKVNTQKLLQEKQAFEDIYHKYAQQIFNDLDNTKSDTQKSDKKAKNQQADNQKSDVPDWLNKHYEQLEAALRYLWRVLFADIYRHRLSLENRFWACLKNDNYRQHFNDVLPNHLYLFTIQQIPQIELDFLKKLSQYCSIYLLHFNPSMMFWADIVDKTWLMQQTIINPNLVYLKDYGHGLLSKLGKASRESFAMLAELSGGEYHNNYQINWQDEFNELQNRPNNLLNTLKKDILMLEEKALPTHIKSFNQSDLHNIQNKHYQSRQFIHSLNNHINNNNTANNNIANNTPKDTSIMIHNCHNLKRQLEISRLYIAKWLNQKNHDGSTRHLSDIVIFLPDIEQNASMIEAVYPKGVAIDGFDLPAKITGLGSHLSTQLFSAICGFYTLSQQMLYANDFFDWLLNPSLYQSMGLSIDDVYRAITLLKHAGFICGLNQKQLKSILHHHDTDYRHTLSTSLDKLVIAVIYGNKYGNAAYYNTHIDNIYFSKLFYPLNKQKTPSLHIKSDDEKIIRQLCLLYQALCQHQDDYKQQKPIIDWLDKIENDIIKKYFFDYNNTDVLRSIFDAMNSMKSAIKANRFYQNTNDDMYLSLEFVLESIGQALKTQQVRSEPTGAITFGRFGSLRSINFGLIIMMDMNFGVFPRTQNNSQFDLAKGFLRRRGDMVSEDDDNGAFLDALLCAKESCWIFYTGQTIGSDVELLPATPVNELLHFFWQFCWQNTTPNTPFNNSDINNSGTNKNNNISHQITSDDFRKQFIIKHSALPFDDNNFYMNDNTNTDNQMPPPILWQTIHQNIKNSNKHFKYMPVIYDGDYDYFKNVLLQNSVIQDLPTTIYLKDIIYAAKKQARHFLENKVSIIDLDDKLTDEAPLKLQGLNKYQSYQLLVNQFKNNTTNSTTNTIGDTINTEYGIDDKMQYGDLLPVGTMQMMTYQQIKQDVYQSQQKFNILLQTHFGQANYTITTSDIQTVHLDITSQNTTATNIIADLPNKNSVQNNNNIATYIKASKISEKHKIELFLTHVLWQCTLDDNDDFKSVCQFTDQCIGFNKIDKKNAYRIIKKWVLFYELSKSLVTAVTPNNLYDSLSENKDHKNQFKTWFLDNKYSASINEESIYHAYWQYIIHDDGSQLLHLSLPIIQLLAEDIKTYEIVFNYLK